MKIAILESDVIDGLAKALDQTKAFIDRLTEYHGGPIHTEYMITADIAREFVRRNWEVKVECLNRTLVNPLVQLRGTTPRKILRGLRTDVAVVEDGLLPLVIVEVKIGVQRLARVKNDLCKIISTMALMKPAAIQRVIGASVFQAHIANTRRRWRIEDFGAAIKLCEANLREDLKVFARNHPQFMLQLHPLHPNATGIASPEVDDEHGELTISRDGHATKYYVVIVRSSTPQQSTSIPGQAL